MSHSGSRFFSLAGRKAAPVFRALLLCVALAGYALNGAQAHIVIPQSETVEVKLCGAHGGRTITMTFGDKDAPIRFSDDSCCGPCLMGALPAYAGPVLPRPDQAALVRVIDCTSVSPPIRYSIWPGAPPHGPPEFLKT